MADSLQTSPVTLADCCPEIFQPLLGETFTFVSDHGDEVSLELLEVANRPRRGHSRDPFSLLFALKSGQIPFNDSLRPRKDGFAQESWFINRVSVLGGDPGIAYCEAVFG
jgi:hypothetical protein